MTKTKKTLNCRERFRAWRLDAVQSYYIKLKSNPTHPFEDLGDGFYYICIRSDKFYFGIGLIISMVFGFTLFCLMVGIFSFPFALLIFVLFYGTSSLFGRLSTRELIISRNGGYIMRLKGTDKVLVEEPIHNVYIKLMRKFDSNLLSHYYLILGGFNLDDIRISGMATEDDALRLLGARLADRMGINYFDYDLNSTLHKIIHYPTFSTLRATDEEYRRFLEQHYINTKEVTMALESEALPSTTTLLPILASEHITKNYIVGSRIGRGGEPLPPPRINAVDVTKHKKKGKKKGEKKGSTKKGSKKVTNSKGSKKKGAKKLGTTNDTAQIRESYIGIDDSPGNDDEPAPKEKKKKKKKKPKSRKTYD